MSIAITLIGIVQPPGHPGQALPGLAVVRRCRYFLQMFNTSGVFTSFRKRTPATKWLLRSRGSIFIAKEKPSLPGEPRQSLPRVAGGFNKSYIFAKLLLSIALDFCYIEKASS